MLACIPLNDSVSFKDVAELAGVPETQLRRIVRMTATAGFLHEPQPGCIGHTSLSAPFVTKLSYLDAVIFLAEVAAPTALQMATATQRDGYPDSLNESAYTLAFNTSQTFHSACEQRTKLRRQWSAYCLCAGDTDDSVVEYLSRLDWQNLGNAKIVDVSINGFHTSYNILPLSIYPPRAWLSRDLTQLGWCSLNAGRNSTCRTISGAQSHRAGK